MEPFQVPCNANQFPFAGHQFQAAEEEAPEPHYRLDDSEYGFHRALARGIDRLPAVVLSRYLILVSASASSGTGGGSLNRSMRGLIMTFTTRGDVGGYLFSSQLLTFASLK